MRFHVSYLATMTLVGVALISQCIKSDSQEFYEAYQDSIPPPVPSIDHTDKSYIVTLPKSDLAGERNFVRSNQTRLKNPISQKVSSLLSPEILSKPDSFQDLIRKTANWGNWEIHETLVELQSRLNKNQFASIYIPYARALQSILRVQRDLEATKRLMKTLRPDCDRSTVPEKISSPMALSDSGLFSVDILCHPDALVRLFDKLTQIPKNEIPKLITLLEDYTELQTELRKAPFKWVDYIWYAKNLLKILTTDVLDDLKRNKAEIQRTRNTNLRSSDDINIEQFLNDY